MGNTATSCLCLRDDDVVSSQESLDPLVSSRGSSKGQMHLLWKKGRCPPVVERFQEEHVHQPTRLIVRKTNNESFTNNTPDNAAVQTHIYAVRKMEEQRPVYYSEQDLLGGEDSSSREDQEQPPMPLASPAELFTPEAMAPTPSLTGTFLF